MCILSELLIYINFNTFSQDYPDPVSYLVLDIETETADVVGLTITAGS